MRQKPFSSIFVSSNAFSFSTIKGGGLHLQNGWFSAKDVPVFGDLLSHQDVVTLSCSWMQNPVKAQLLGHALLHQTVDIILMSSGFSMWAFVPFIRISTVIFFFPCPFYINPWKKYFPLTDLCFLPVKKKNKTKTKPQNQNKKPSNTAKQVFHE